MIPVAIATRVTEKRVAVRTRTFIGSTPEEILAELRRERFTGRMSFDMSQGGVCTVQVEDRAAISHLTAGNNSA